MAEPFTPETYVKLYANVPLDNTYQNTIDFFKNQSEQIAFFENYIKNGFVNFTYQRERRAIRVPLVYDLVSTVNYCAYQNSNFTKKWFFAFVTEVRYVNPSCTELIIEQDVFQTWLFDYSVRQGYIEREHVENDTIGLHTVPENLETGPYITTNTASRIVVDLEVFALSTETFGLDGWNPPSVVGGFPISCYWRSYGRLSGISMNALQHMLDTAASQGKADAIIAVYTSPFGWVSKETEPLQYTLPAAPPFTNYTPRNNKLLTYPYICLGVVAGGQGAELRYELFANRSAPTLKCFSGFGPNMTISCIPVDYAGQAYSFQHTVTLSDFPLCTWVTNYYQNWLAQNSARIEVGNLTAVASIILGAASLGSPNGGSSGMSTIVSGLSRLGDQYAMMYQQSIIPDKMLGNAEAANINAVSRLAGIYTYCRTIQPEYAKIIDDYFHAFGYKVNRIGVSNTKSRLHWNYVKTIGANIWGNMPQDHLNVIKAAYDNGITFWHDSGVANYNQDNPIVNVG